MAARAGCWASWLLGSCTDPMEPGCPCPSPTFPVSLFHEMHCCPMSRTLTCPCAPMEPDGRYRGPCRSPIQQVSSPHRQEWCRDQRRPVSNKMREESSLSRRVFKRELGAEGRVACPGRGQASTSPLATSRSHKGQHTHLPSHSPLRGRSCHQRPWAERALTVLEPG